MRRFGPLVFVCGLILVSTVSYGQRRGLPKRGAVLGRVMRQNGNDLPPVLRLAVRAAGTLRYSGTRLVDQKVKNLLVRHEEYVLRSGRRVRITFPNDSQFSGQIIVDDGNQRLHYLPGPNQIRVEPGYRDDTLNRLVDNQNRLKRPRVTIVEGGVVAGLRTRLANIVDKNNQIVQQLWIDPRTGAVLKRIGYNKNGETVAYFEYTSIRYNVSIGSQDFTIKAPGARTVRPEDDLRAQAQVLRMPPFYIPPSTGFRLVSVRHVKRVRQDVLAQVYQGPKGRVSLFELYARIDPSVLEAKANGAQRVTTLERDGVTIVIIGPYDKTVLDSLGSSIRRF